MTQYFDRNGNPISPARATFYRGLIEEDKQAYATAYALWLANDRNGPEPRRGSLSEFAAKPIREAVELRDNERRAEQARALADLRELEACGDYAKVLAAREREERLAEAE